MFDNLGLDAFVGWTLHELPIELLQDAGTRQYRPTIKAVLFGCAPDSTDVRTASYRVGQLQHNPLARLFNLPGGGVQTADSCWVDALARELREELGNLPVTRSQLEHATVLRVEEQQTRRPNYRGKLAVIVAVSLRSDQCAEACLQPTNDELQALQFVSLGDTVRRLLRMRDTRHCSYAAYIQAYLQLLKLLQPQT